MNSRRPPPLPVALLERCVPGSEPLAGDLLEEWVVRSDAWLWWQVLHAVFSGMVLHLRTSPRLIAEKVLVTTAMLALLGFCTVVVAVLVNRVIALGAAWFPETGRYQDLQLYFTAPAFAGAVMIGRLLGRVHPSHRILFVLGCSVTATGAACLNVYLFVPDAVLQPLFPHAATQIALGTIFVAGLFAGIGSRSQCEPRLLS